MIAHRIILASGFVLNFPIVGGGLPLKLADGTDLTLIVVEV